MGARLSECLLRTSRGSGRRQYRFADALVEGSVSRFIKYGYVLLGRSPAVFLRVVPKRLHVITTQHFEQFGASVQKAFVPRRPSIG